MELNKNAKETKPKVNIRKEITRTQPRVSERKSKKATVNKTKKLHFLGRKN